MHNILWASAGPGKAEVALGDDLALNLAGSSVDGQDDRVTKLERQLAAGRGAHFIELENTSGAEDIDEVRRRADL